MSVRCPKCKTQLDGSPNFCPDCGAKLNSGDVTAPAPPPDSGSSRPSSSPDGRFVTGQRLGGRYRIVECLGRGGMGEVYRADDLELGQSVALKFLPERLAGDERALDRLRGEVRLARSVSHANVCRVYDLGQAEGHIFISMEYIDGEDLADALRRMGRPSPEKAAELARQICLGLGAAHEVGVLHRDLKPANIMIDGRGRARITDFGLAHLTETGETPPELAGTPAYMAPEQLSEGHDSIESDIYSLGLVLHELFTGRRFIDADSVEEVRARHASGSSTSSLTDLDPQVERAVERCLEPDPRRRPRSAYQVLAALPGGDPLAAALAAGETPSPELVVNARDAGGLRAPVAAVLLIVLLASLGVTGFIWKGKTVLPKRSPAELSVLARQALDRLGDFSDSDRFHSISGYDVNTQLVRTPPGEWPPRFRFWRRWSFKEFLPAHYHGPEVFRMDGPPPPMDSATVALDSEGRLLSLAVPPFWLTPANEDAGQSPYPDPDSEVDWSPFFELAQLNPSDWKRSRGTRLPPVTCFDTASWHRDGYGTVQMGATGGRLNYFEFVDLRGFRDSTPPQFITTFAGFPKLGWGILIFMVVIALHNLRASRSDRRNAIRFALLIGGLYTLMEVLALPLGARISMDRVQQFASERAIGHILLHTLQGWFLYMAVEPYVRRVWPRMLVGVVRMLSGRLRDPAVGREVLIGSMTGCGLMALMALLSAVVWRIEGEDGLRLLDFDNLWSSLSPLHYLSMKMHRAAWTVMDAANFAGLLVALRLLTRRTWITVILGIGLLSWMIFLSGVSGLSDLTGPFAMIYAVAAGAAFVLLYTRVGILAGVVCVFLLVPYNLFTAGFDTWISPYGAAELGLILAVAAYGFWVSLAGQPILKDLLAEPTR